jgi:glycosyltransferase involved in cell wall biosynthesis
VPEDARQGDSSAAAAAEPAPGPPPIRVAWVAGPRTIDRFARTLRPLAIGLLDEVVHLAVVCPDGTETEVLPIPPIRTVGFARPKWWTSAVRLAETVAARLRPHKVQVLHALDADAAPLTARLAELIDRPYVLSAHALGDGRRVRHLRGPLAAVLAGSEPIGEALRRRAPADRTVHLLRPGVHQVRHATCFNDPQHSLSIVVSGPLDDRDAYMAALHSFAELLARHYDCAFFVIGAGPAEKALRAVADRLDLRRDLTFAEPKSAWQMAGLFKSADLYIAPAARDELDIDCLLAMAAGVPVLAAGGGAADFLRDGQTALLYARADAAELTMKLLGMLEDRAAARDLAEGALDYLRRHHSPAAMVAALADIYRRVVAEGVAARPAG